MKIECDKCGAKYAIADEKVRGKTFKIRCKKCSNVIIVRDKAAGDEAAEPEQAPEDDASGWHLVIDRDTVGPISEQEVRDRFAAGEIDGNTSVWQEGFDDWLPLSSVDTFGDLAAVAAPAEPEPEPEPAAAVGGVAAAAADPFAGSSDDDYGGGYNEPEPEPELDAGHSPRVDDLTGARNENSVLFSLDSLSAVALGGGGGGGVAASQQPVASGPSFSVAPASTAPSQTTAQGEGSGLIDIRAMSAMLGDSGGDGGGGGESFGEAAIPSFGGGFGGLAAAPLSIDSPESGAVAVAPEPVRSSNGPLYALIGVLAIGLIAVAGYVVTRPPPEGKTTEIIKEVVPGQVPMDDDDGGRKKKKKKNDDDDDDDDEDDEEDESGADDGSSGTKKTKKTSTRKKSSGSSAAASGSDKPADSGTKEAAPKPVEKKPDDVSVDCLLDPSKCKKAGGSKPSGGGGGGSSAPPDSSLPAKLTAADIKSGYASAKTAAQNNCKSKAKGGEKVGVKLSIEGSSGKVVSATSDGTPLGTCVANELKKATFKKFQAAQQGVQVSLRF